MEDAVRRTLRAFLPRRYGVASEYIVSSRPARSRDIDIILYDALAAPVFGSGSDGRGVIIPVETVLGIVEVKSTFTSKELADASKQSRVMKRLVPGVRRKNPETAPFSCAIFYRLGNLKAKRQIDSKKRLLQERLLQITALPRNERLDAVLVLDAENAQQDGWHELNSDGMSVFTENSDWIKDGPLAFSFFLCWLLGRLMKGSATTPNIGAYLLPQDD